jgi:hypothetical protein
MVWGQVSSRQPFSSEQVLIMSRLRREASTDRAEMTSPLGFFNFALSYRAAGDKLRVCKLRATHPHSPILFVYYHAIELYLKAFLRAQGLSVASLQDIGHKFNKLQRLCTQHHLDFDDKDEAVLARIAEDGAWAATRYLTWDYRSGPAISELSRTCRRLDRSVAKALSAKGIHTRQMRRGVRVSD